MHLKRWISALIMAPLLVLFTLYAPSWLFGLFILAMISVGLHEFYALTLPGMPSRKKFAAIFLALLPALALFSPDPRCFYSAVALFAFCLFIHCLWIQDPFAARVDGVSKAALGFFYVSFFLAHFILLRRLPSGPLWILFILVAVYFGDTTAFYVGRTWGRHKLAPAISPGKTVEGGLGAAGGSLAGALLFQWLFFPQFSLPHALALGLGIGVIGQLGDLWESVLKRSAKAKDSGTLIPGHGGLLDRVDSVLFAGPFVYYYVWIAGLAN